MFAPGMHCYRGCSEGDPVTRTEALKEYIIDIAMALPHYNNCAALDMDTEEECDCYLKKLRMAIDELNRVAIVVVAKGKEGT